MSAFSYIEMSASGTITMTMREVDRLRTIQSVVDGMLMTWQAAERLHLSRRQVERLTVRYRSQGASGLLSRHRGPRTAGGCPCAGDGAGA
ncbi:Helix-turn-helix domain-containing protein [Burkholderia sp. OK233]|nr:Helix-turn-helix domain-containing protein [Burkholderia sp. OK233]